MARSCYADLHLARRNTRYGLGRSQNEGLDGRQQQYEICDGRYQVEVAGTSSEVTVYKLGDKYMALRSNEFGYANYETEGVNQWLVEVCVVRQRGLEESEALVRIMISPSPVGRREPVHGPVRQAGLRKLLGVFE